MNKQLIGFLRLVIVFGIAWILNLSFSAYDLKLFVSDLVHGAHTPELRDSVSVNTIMIVVLGLFSFYVLQSLVYLLVPAVQERNTSLINFIKLSVKALGEIGKDPYFWTNGSNDGNLENINRVLSYRDNKMALMSNEKAVEFMKGTGHIDMLLSRPDLKQSRKALSYLNNKMAFMSNESALNFMKDKK